MEKVKLSEIRAKFPMYGDLSDDQLLIGLRKTYYADMPMGEFVKRIDYDTQRPDAAQGQGFWENALQGLGKAVSDTGFGAKQLAAEVGNKFGLVQDKTVSALRSAAGETKRLDRSLMDTWGGKVGNVAGNTALALAPGLGAYGLGAKVASRAMLAAPSTLGGILGGASAGAIQGAVQPVGEDDSRTSNVMLGAAGGAAVPVIGATYKVAREAVRPATEAGRRVIVGRALNQAAGTDAPQVISKLRAAQELVPGAAPTAADVAENGGIAALQRAAGAVDPMVYAARNSSKVDAWRQALGGIAKDDAAMGAAEAARKSAAEVAYSAADAGIAPVDKFFRNLQMRPQMSQAIKQAQRLAKNDGLDDIFFRDANGQPTALIGQGAHYIKKALDDAAEFGSSSYAGKNSAAAALKTQGEFLTWLEKSIPEYAAAKDAFAQASKPINSMQIGRELQKAMNPTLTPHGAIGGVHAESFGRAINNPATVKRATGMDKPLSGVLSSTDLATVQNLARDLARNQNAQNLGRGVGSNTVQNMAMTNLLQRSGVPLGVLNVPYVGTAMNWGFKNADEQLKELLAQGLLSPSQAAQLMEEAAKQTGKDRLGIAARPVVQGLLASQLAQ